MKQGIRPLNETLAEHGFGLRNRTDTRKDSKPLNRIQTKHIFLRLNGIERNQGIWTSQQNPNRTRFQTTINETDMRRDSRPLNGTRTKHDSRPLNEIEMK